MNRWLMRTAAGVFAWALARDLAAPDINLDYPGLPKGEVWRLAMREMMAIRWSIIEHARYQDREKRILSDRLARRFDLGQALNESASRAINQGAVPPPGYPTEKQKLALKLQEETLRQRLRDHLP